MRGVRPWICIRWSPFFKCFPKRGERCLSLFQNSLLSRKLSYANSSTHSCLTRSKKSQNNSHTNSCLPTFINSNLRLTKSKESQNNSHIQTLFYQLSSIFIFVWPGARKVKTTLIQTLVYQLPMTLVLPLWWSKTNSNLRSSKSLFNWQIYDPLESKCFYIQWHDKSIPPLGPVQDPTNHVQRHNLPTCVSRSRPISTRRTWSLPLTQSTTCCRHSDAPLDTWSNDRGLRIWCSLPRQVNLTYRKPVKQVVITGLK